MSAEPPTLAAPPIRRRIVSAPQRTATPVALIVRERPLVAALEAQIQQTRPVVVFPSLAHFCTEQNRSERWGGVIVARACAWDARLDKYVLDHDCLALYGEAEGYGWPESVKRLRDEEVGGWLGGLDTPRLPKPVVRARPKRISEPGASRARQKRSAFSFWEPRSVVSDHGETGKDLAQANGEAAKPAPIKPVRKAHEGRSTTQQTLPFVDVAKRGRRGSGLIERSPEVEAVARAVAEDSLRERARLFADNAAPHAAEEIVARVAVEIGLRRAYQVLEQLRARAKQLV
jgi:hypothetical protein